MVFVLLHRVLQRCLDLGAGQLHRHSIVRLRFFIGGLFERGKGGGRILRGRGGNHPQRLPMTCTYEGGTSAKNHIVATN